MNRKSSIAKKRMREKNDNAHRPEQMLVAEILQYHVPGEISTEHKLQSLTPIDGLNFTGKRSPIVDVYLVQTLRKYVIRINGPSHDTEKRRRYDRAQKIFLECQKDNFVVIDVSYIRHELLFERNRRKLTQIELYSVLDLLRDEFRMYGIHFDLSKTAVWLSKTEHQERSSKTL